MLLTILPVTSVLTLILIILLADAVLLIVDPLANVNFADWLGYFSAISVCCWLGLGSVSVGAI